MQEKAAEKADAVALRAVDCGKLAKMSLEELLYYVLIGEGKQRWSRAGA
jgi:hypothetical protein